MTIARNPTASLLLCAWVSVLPAWAKLTPEQISELPPPATRAIDFKTDIVPILNSSCVKCHGRGKEKGGFKLDTRETFLKPGDSGPATISGDSAHSLLIELVSGLDPDNIMPQKGSKLTREQIALLRAWIDQGLKWDDDVTFAKPPPNNLKPRKVEPAAATASAHPIDRLLEPYFAQNSVKPSPAVDDHVFARRVYLDLVGLLPSPAELEAFEKDSRPNKRTELVRRLLADSQRYAQHWMAFWNDLLRNDYRGTGYIDGGREPISKWLYAALRDNMPYDRFVAELINPSANDARGFIKGIVWRGTVNASQLPPIQAAQNVSQVFMGVNLKCASCHDSFIDDWQLSDAYGLAGVFAEQKLDMVQCDRPLGKHASAKFIFAELGGIDDNAPRAERMAQLARIITSKENGRLSRTIVNRLWARFLGRGLVEPLDVMQNVAWNPDLLDWLAEDLVAHDYNLKRTMELILTAQAYQLPSVNHTEKLEKDYVFTGPSIRRLSAEQFRDAVGQLTGVWNERPEGGLDILLLEKGEPSALAAPAYWVWSDAHAADGVSPQTIYLRRKLELPEVPTEAVIYVNADNSHRLYINGKEARRANNFDWSETSVLDARPFLEKGSNLIAVEAVNGGEGPNAAGLLFYARIRTKGSDGSQQILDIGSDGSWRVSTSRFEDWQKPSLNDEGWAKAQVLGPPNIAPWNLGSRFAAAVAGRTVYGSVRASLVAADPLAIALGRPNREQVTSSRSMVATTLQALELTNGRSLSDVLRQGSQKLSSDFPQGEALVQQVFRRALGRPPSNSEASLAQDIVGERAKSEGVEDLLWAIAMLPEFQLVL